jgi:hypothetical protein
MQHIVYSVHRRLQFEAAQPPCFNLVQQSSAGWSLLGSRPTKMSFKAASVDDCCEWTIAIREAIAVASGREAGV